MIFCTRTPFIPWTQIPLCCLHLYCRNHHYCQHHNPLFILLCLIIAQILVITGGVLVAIGAPTATATITRIGSNLLQTGGQTIGSRTCVTQGLDSGLDSRMLGANYAQTSATQLLIVPNFTTVPNNSLLILLLGTFLLRHGSLTPMQINTSHLILQL